MRSPSASTRKSSQIWRRFGRYQTTSLSIGQTVDISVKVVEGIRTMLPNRKTGYHRFVELFRNYTKVKNDGGDE